MIAVPLVTMIAASEIRTTATVTTHRVPSVTTGAVVLVAAVEDVAVMANRVVSEPSLREHQHPALPPHPEHLNRDATVEGARVVPRIVVANLIGLSPTIAAPHPADAMDGRLSNRQPNPVEGAVTAAA